MFVKPNLHKTPFSQYGFYNFNYLITFKSSL